MEKIKFGDTLLDMVSNGTQYMGERLQIVFACPAGLSYEQMEEILANVDRIELLSEQGELLQVYKGYTCLYSLRKQYDYVIRTEQVEDGQDEAGNALYANQDVTGTVMVAILKQPDLRTQLEQLAEELTMTQLAMIEMYEAVSYTNPTLPTERRV